ncbi:MAG: hypothetical protein QM715_21265 [Nibricoccus sp.]
MTPSPNPELGYLANAFEKLVMAHHKRRHYMCLAVIFVGVCLSDASHTFAALVIGFGIGLFAASAAAAGITRQRLQICRAKKTDGQFVDVEVQGVSMRFDSTAPSLKWVSAEKTAFWSNLGVVFCDLRGTQAEKKSRTRRQSQRL